MKIMIFSILVLLCGVDYIIKYIKRLKRTNGILYNNYITALEVIGEYDPELKKYMEAGYVKRYKG